MRDQDLSKSRTLLLLDSLSGGISAVDRSATIPCPNVLVHTLALQPDTAFGKPLTTLPARAAVGALRLDETRASHLFMNRRTHWPQTSGGRYFIGFSDSPCRDPEETIPGAVLAVREIGSLSAGERERNRADQIASVGFIEGTLPTGSATAKWGSRMSPQRGHAERSLACSLP